jgi:hypothetical protein
MSAARYWGALSPLSASITAAGRWCCASWLLTRPLLAVYRSLAFRCPADECGVRLAGQELRPLVQENRVT